MKAILSVFIAATAVKGLVETSRGKKRDTFQERPWHKLLLVCSGFISGAFGCGGPLTVIYTRNRYRDKDMFRVMQFGCGTFSMGLSTLGHVASGSYTIASLPVRRHRARRRRHRAARQHLAREADEHHVFPAAGQRRAAFLCALADVAGGAGRVSVTLDIARPS